MNMIGDMTLPINQIICGDCLEVMKDWPDNCVDLVLTDPPYGIGMHRQIGKKKGEVGDKWKADNWDSKQPDIQDCLRIAKNQIIWGGNYFPLPPTRCFLVWDMVQRIDFADCIMAWTNFNTSARIFTYARSNLQGFRFPERQHPTQKPIELMLWCLKNYSQPTNLILDPFCGSGTTCAAAKMLGRNYIGIDISEDYCKIARERIGAVETGVPVKEARKGQMGLFSK